MPSEAASHLTFLLFNHHGQSFQVVKDGRGACVSSSCAKTVKRCRARASAPKLLTWPARQDLLSSKGLIDVRVAGLGGENDMLAKNSGRVCKTRGRVENGGRGLVV